MEQVTSLNNSGSVYDGLATESAGVGKEQGKAYGVPVSVPGSNLSTADQKRLRSDENASTSPDTERTATKLPDETLVTLNKEILELKSKITVELEKQFTNDEQGVSKKGFDYDHKLKMITDKRNDKRELFFKSKEYKGMNEFLTAMEGLKDRVLPRVSYFITDAKVSYPPESLIYYGFGLSVNPESLDPCAAKRDMPSLNSVATIFKGFRSLFDHSRKEKCSSESSTPAGSEKPMPATGESYAGSGGNIPTNPPSNKESGITDAHGGDLPQPASPESQEGNNDALNIDEDNNTPPKNSRMRERLNSLFSCWPSNCTKYRQVDDEVPADDVGGGDSAGRGDSPGALTSVVNENTKEPLSETDPLLAEKPSEPEKLSGKAISESDLLKEDKKCFFVLAVLAKILDGIPDWLKSKDRSEDDLKSGFSVSPDVSHGGSSSATSPDENSGLDKSSELSEMEVLQEEKNRLENMLSMLKELSSIENLIQSLKCFVDYEDTVQLIIKAFSGENSDRLDDLMSRFTVKNPDAQEA